MFVFLVSFFVPFNDDFVCVMNLLYEIAAEYDWMYYPWAYTGLRCGNGKVLLWIAASITLSGLLKYDSYLPFNCWGLRLCCVCFCLIRVFIHDFVVTVRWPSHVSQNVGFVYACIVYWLWSIHLSTSFESHLKRITVFLIEILLLLAIISIGCVKWSTELLTELITIVYDIGDVQANMRIHYTYMQELSWNISNEWVMQHVVLIFKIIN